MTGLLIQKLQETLSQELTAIHSNNIPAGLNTAGYTELFKTLIEAQDFTTKEVEMLRESLEVRGKAVFHLEKNCLEGEKKVKFRGFESSHLSAMHQRTINIESLANILCPFIYAYSTLYTLFEEEKSLLMPIDWKTEYIDQAEEMLKTLNKLDMGDSRQWNYLCDEFNRIMSKRVQALEDYTDNFTPPATPDDQGIGIQESWLESMQKNSLLLLNTWDDMQYLYSRIQEFLDDSQQFPSDDLINDLYGKSFDSVHIISRRESNDSSVSQSFFAPPKTPRLRVEHYYDTPTSKEMTCLT